MPGGNLEPQFRFRPLSQTCSFTTNYRGITKPPVQGKWCGIQDSNLHGANPRRSKRRASTIPPIPHIYCRFRFKAATNYFLGRTPTNSALAGAVGLEPTYPGLTDRCCNQFSYAPMLGKTN